MGGKIGAMARASSGLLRQMVLVGLLPWSIIGTARVIGKCYILMLMDILVGIIITGETLKVRSTYLKSRDHH